MVELVLGGWCGVGCAPSFPMVPYLPLFPSPPLPYCWQSRCRHFFFKLLEPAWWRPVSIFPVGLPFLRFCPCSVSSQAVWFVLANDGVCRTTLTAYFSFPPVHTCITHSFIFLVTFVVSHSYPLSSLSSYSPVLSHVPLVFGLSLLSPIYPFYPSTS